MCVHVCITVQIKKLKRDASNKAEIVLGRRGEHTCAQSKPRVKSLEMCPLGAALYTSVSTVTSAFLVESLFALI